MSAVDQVPDWAWTRVIELHEAEVHAQLPLRQAFARYIAAHEEAPVDPAVIAGRKLVVETQHNWPESPWHIQEAEETLAGRRDFTLVVKAAVEGVRRGMELAQATNNPLSLETGT